MSDDPRIQPVARAAPVAGLPLDSLLARAEAIAKRWATALVLARPLDRLAELPLEDLAREAPPLCAQLVRALGSEAELDDLAGSRATAVAAQQAPARRLARIAGARDAAALVEAVEALRGAVWEMLLEELRWPLSDHAYAHRVADLSDRLAHVCAVGLAAALGAAQPAAGAGEAQEEPPAARGTERGAEAGPLRVPAGDRVVIIDERDPAASCERRRPPDIDIRDERAEAGPAAWIGSIGRQLERFRRDGGSFAVLLVELAGLESPQPETSSVPPARLMEDVEQLLAAELRAAAAASAARAPGRVHVTLTRERPGRYWLLAPDTDRTGATALAERITGGVRRLVGGRARLLEIAIGTAVCPEDGREAAALAAYADLDLYAARAAARTAPGRQSPGEGRP